MKAEQKEGICRLCREVKELRNSNIASKFLWMEGAEIGNKNGFALGPQIYSVLFAEIECLRKLMDSNRTESSLSSNLSS